MNFQDLPYLPAGEYSKRVAYFSMEFAIDQCLKIYGGGLGFLSGSHMRSAYELKQNLIGIGILWKYGYYDQNRNSDQTLRVDFIEKNYTFLEDTGIVIDVHIFDNPHVKVKVYKLNPETFQTVPVYLLSTDIPENDYLSRTITYRLYDDNELTRVAQSIVLGQGGAKLVELLGGADVYHLNEGHALPAFTYLYGKATNKEAIRAKFVFTTHTPEKAGNEEHSLDLLKKINFFPGWTDDEIEKITHQTPGVVNYTLAALRLAKKANAVSKLHGIVARQMWEVFEGICEIDHITNAQSLTYWGDAPIQAALANKDYEAIVSRKKELKNELFRVVADQTGKLFDPDVITIVWARRFAAYKRPDLLFWNLDRFMALLENKKYPVQIIWAGKPYPTDYRAIDIFNQIVYLTRHLPNACILTGYELELSRILKNGTDVWLNTPRKLREASGTSGMTAAMNGAVNFSINDGWMVEFGQHRKNCYLIPDTTAPGIVDIQDREDFENLYKVLEEELLPDFYEGKGQWKEVMMNSMTDVLKYFISDRMADEYYKKLYHFNPEKDLNQDSSKKKKTRRAT
ncbi:alpha-glucan family phosphorylase [Schleiferia thermophila]